MPVKRLGILGAVRAIPLLLAVLALFPDRLPAAETRVVDVISLGRLGTGLSADGWEVSSVTNYGDSYSNALRFNVKASVAISPVFDAPVTRIRLQTISSTNAYRCLTFTPLRDGVADTNLARTCTYSRTKNVFLEQTLEWPRTERVRVFRIELVGSGATAWGVRQMTVISDDPACGTVITLR